MSDVGGADTRKGGREECRWSCAWPAFRRGDEVIVLVPSWTQRIVNVVLDSGSCHWDGVPGDWLAC